MGTIIRSALYLLFILTINSSCSKSGTKALDRGDYYNAVFQSVERLKKDTDNKKSLEVLPEAYSQASEELLKDISIAKNANQQFRWERVLESYAKLNQMHDLITNCIPCRRVVNPTGYFREAESVRELAAEERYLHAQQLLDKKTIESGRAAFDSFQRLYAFAPDFKDVQAKLDEALNAGSLHVVLEHPIVNSRLYNISNEYFKDRIDEFLRENKRLNKFIRFYSPEEAGELRLQPDHVIKLEFVDFVVGETRIEKNTSTVTSKDSVKTGTAKINGKEVAVYAKVTAKLTQNKKIVSSKGLLAMEIFDFQNNRVLRKEEFPGEYLWVNEWASFNGDERALTSEQLARSKRSEQLPPPPQQLFVEFCKPIYSQLTNRIKTFYDRY
jgi:hypothetical protein